MAREFPNHRSINYASPWAGAHYRPVPGSSPQALREASQARRTYEHFKKLSVEEPASGVEFLEGVEHLDAPPPEYLRINNDQKDVYSHLDYFALLPRDELPDGVKWGARYWTFVVNPPVYCAFLLRKFILRGGRTREYTLANTPMEAFKLAPNLKTVVNCSGVGFADPKSFIIRGMYLTVDPDGLPDPISCVELRNFIPLLIQY